MPAFNIRVDLSQLLNLAPALSREIFPRLHEAVGAVAQAGHAQWADAVMKARLWEGERNDYAQSITWDYTGPFSAEIRSDYRHAAAIETGRPARDLKRMLDTSLKVRRTEDGRRFLVIPMRHNTPGANATGSSMPFEVYAMARNLAASMVSARSHRPAGEVTTLDPKRGMSPSANQTPFASNPSSHGHSMVPSRSYTWGDRLATDALKEHGKDVQKRYAGMVRFESSSGSESRSSYMTFRIMMEGSSGWIVPAKPGLFLAKQVADRLQPLAEQAFSQAVKLDLGG